MRNSDAILNCLMNVVLAANPGEKKEPWMNWSAYAPDR